jgi:hypothetical protein
MSNETQKTSIQIDLGELESRITWGKRFAWFLVVCGAIAAAWGLYIIYNDKTDSLFLEKLSFVGSFFQGAVGSLWALAGLMFIYVAFLGQKQQLLLQREEMEGQEKQFQSQQESIKRQNFESAFFQLLNLHNQNVVQLQGHINGREEKGRACFVGWFNELFKPDFRSWLLRKSGGNIQTINIESLNVASEYYLDFYANNRANFAHYFRTLYHIFKFVKNGDIPDSEKKRYASLTRAQLSANELAFLFYNGISPYGEKFKPLIEEFGLLEHLDEDKLLHPSHKNFYAQKAWK